MEEQRSMKLGSYYLIRRLARGGMAEVYLVLDERDEEFYALKMVRQQDEEDCQRFLQEVQVLMHLEHPHILPIVDSGSQNGVCYYVMPYIAHGTLKDRLAQGPLNAQEAGSVLAQVADALQFLHAAGFVHRDVKPSNLLQDETNYIWLADFGLVRAMEGGSDLTRTGYLLGTPSYMAPELEKAQASASSDVYSLGVVLYEMLTGHLPFTGETLLDIYLKQVYEQPLSPSDVNPLISPGIEQVVLRALEKKPADRYLSAQALAEAYQEVLRVEHPEPGAQGARVLPPMITIRKQKQQYRRRMPLALGALVALAVLTLSLVSMSAVSHNGFSLLSLNSAHALSVQTKPGSPKPTSTPSRTTTLPGTFPSKGSASVTPGSTPTPSTTPSVPSDPSGDTPPPEATSPVSSPTPTSSPTPGEPTPVPTTPPVSTPTPGVTTPTPTSTPGNSDGNGNQGGKGKGKGKGHGGN